MSWEFEVDVHDLKEVERRIQRLTSAVVSKDVEDVLVGGARIIKTEVRRRAPVGPTGDLKRSAVAKRSKARSATFRAAIAAIDRKKAPHANLVEYGTPTVRIPRTSTVLYDKQHTGQFFGKEVARMPAQPFFRPAIEATSAEVSRYVANGIKNIIEGKMR